MALLYTNKGNEVYVDDSKVHLLDGYRIVEHRRRVSVVRGSEIHSIIKFLFNHEKNVLARRKNLKIFDFRESNITFKVRASKYHGVKMLNGYMSPYYTLDCRRVELGLYTSEYDAAVVREYTIKRDNIKATPTGISLTDKELEEEYIRVMKDRDNQNTERKENWARRRQETMDKRATKHGIMCKGENFYARIRVGDRVIQSGGYSTYEEAAIVRNCYITEHDLTARLSKLDMPIEKQLELRKDIRTVVETRRLNKKLRDGGK